MKLTKFFIAFTFLLAFAVCISAQTIQFPNELKGYSFFENKKLKKLKLGNSTMEDVKEVFGKNCIFGCDYNQQWNINFSYFSNITVVKNLSEKKVEYISAPNLSETLYSITFQPKSSILLETELLLPIFKLNGKTSYSYTKNEIEETISLVVYTDEYGLEYSILDKILSTENSKPSKLKNGDLFSVTYRITDELKRKIFIEQK